MATADNPTVLAPPARRPPAAVRVAFGALLLATPRLLNRRSGLSRGGEAVAIPARMVAVREITLELGMWRAGRGERDPRPWLLSSAAIDGKQGACRPPRLARRRLPPIPALGFAVADAGGAMVAAGIDNGASFRAGPSRLRAR